MTECGLMHDTKPTAATLIAFKKFGVQIAIIAMGISLKKRAVAEGIETKKQLTFLQSRHCSEG